MPIFATTALYLVVWPQLHACPCQLRGCLPPARSQSVRCSRPLQQGLRTGRHVLCVWVCAPLAHATAEAPGWGTEEELYTVSAARAATSGVGDVLALYHVVWQRVKALMRARLSWQQHSHTPWWFRQHPADFHVF